MVGNTVLTAAVGADNTGEGDVGREVKSDGICTGWTVVLDVGSTALGAGGDGTRPWKVGNDVWTEGDEAGERLGSALPVVGDLVFREPVGADVILVGNLAIGCIVVVGT